ncbi:hypothetical protein JL108_11615 [Aeromicrobium sp. YIM 150415]|uniref:hypothetical protein n=1 Tax=Aeromicrobium sp. YIM 150415 TaxID=2803912 RepID=UPI0019642160|nr:hypothetical protein [Aeromicrobium sp. YIM 150415]MBM9464098.1 hypothetical protein [Aeromicrobium sp. YIM 150415]
MSRDRTARTRIRQYLASHGPIVEPSGYATGVLKDAVGYSGSSVAFIQLIAAMDREGEIEREIRGKRTYRITGLGVPPVATGGESASSQTGATTTLASPGLPPIELDYKLLAQALVQELLTVTAAARPAGDSEQSARVSAERDEYARRLEIARRQIDELLGEPLKEAAPADGAVGGRRTE